MSGCRPRTDNGKRNDASKDLSSDGELHQIPRWRHSVAEFRGQSIDLFLPVFSNDEISKLSPKFQLRRRFAEEEAERGAEEEAEEAVIHPARHARRLAARAALADSPTGPATDQAIVEPLAQRFEGRHLWKVTLGAGLVILALLLMR